MFSTIKNNLKSSFKTLKDLFGTGWKTILEDSFGVGYTTIGARSKSVVVSVDTSDTLILTAYGLGTADMTIYVTDAWN